MASGILDNTVAHMLEPNTSYLGVHTVLMMLGLLKFAFGENEA